MKEANDSRGVLSSAETSKDQDDDNQEGSVSGSSPNVARLSNDYDQGKHVFTPFRKRKLRDDQITHMVAGHFQKGGAECIMSEIDIHY